MFLGRRHPTEQHEILDGIGAKPGGADIHIKYFTVKKCASSAIISQNPGFIEIQVLELVYTQYFIRELFNPGPGIDTWYRYTGTR